MKRVLMAVVLIASFSTGVFALKIKEEKKATADGGYSEPNFSPEGSKFLAVKAGVGLVVYKADGTGRDDITPAGERVQNPTFNKKGTKIVTDYADMNPPLQVITLGTKKAFKIIERFSFDSTWAFDGDAIFYTYWKLNHGVTESKMIWYDTETNSSEEVRKMYPDRRMFKKPFAHPDGDRVFYVKDPMKELKTIMEVSRETGKQKIFVANIKGDSPAFSSDGKYIWTGAEIIVCKDKTIIPSPVENIEKATWINGDILMFNTKVKDGDKIKEADLGMLDAETMKFEIFKTPDFLEIQSSFSWDGKNAICVDAKDGNLVLITLE